MTGGGRGVRLIGRQDYPIDCVFKGFNAKFPSLSTGHFGVWANGGRTLQG